MSVLDIISSAAVVYTSYLTSLWHPPTPTNLATFWQLTVEQSESAWGKIYILNAQNI